MTCFLKNIKTGESLVAITELISLEFKDEKIIINDVVEFDPKEILEITYKRESGDQE